MATGNPFDLLVDDDNDDPLHLVQKLAPPPTVKPVGHAIAQAQQAKINAAKLPSKPLPPAQAVREAKTEAPRGGGRFGGRGAGRGRGGRGFNRDSSDNNENTYGSNNGFSGGYNRPSEEGDVEKSNERRGYGGPPRGGYRGGGRRGGYSNGDGADGERPRRTYDRRSGTGRGSDFKRDGAGRGNWGTPTDDGAPETEEPVNETEKVVDAEKPATQEDTGDVTKENTDKEPEEKEPEDKEMTLEEYEKVLEENRKALLKLKAEERKVVLDKDFEKMQLLSNKKSTEEEIFVKLGTDKVKGKDAADKEEKAKKSLSINEFLKPADGDKYYSPGGRGRGGRGRGPRGGYNGGRFSDAAAPSIGDASQFPSLGVK